MASAKRWTIQWHIAADGTVIRQRSRGDAEHQQLFQRYATTRTPRIEEIDAMQERLRRSSVSAERLSRVLLYPGYVAVLGLVLGIVLPLLGIETGFLALGSLAFVIIAGITAGVVLRTSNTRFQDAYREAGFDSSNGVTIAGGEARLMVADPGAVSGREFAAVRA